MMINNYLKMCLASIVLIAQASVSAEEIQFSSKLNLIVFARGNNGNGPTKVVGETPADKIKIPSNAKWGIHLKKKVDAKTLYAECIEKGVYNIDFHFVFPKGYLNGIEKVGGLKSLTFFGTGITDDNLAHVADLKKLDHLTICGYNNVSSEGLVHISKLTTLEHLDLSAVSISEKDLKYLEELTGLKTLIIKKEALSKNSIDMLQKALPECTIK